MGKLAEAFKEYLDNTPSEQLKKDWEELKKYNKVGLTDKKEGLTPLQKFCIKANVNWLQYEILTTTIGNIFNLLPTAQTRLRPIYRVKRGRIHE